LRTGDAQRHRVELHVRPYGRRRLHEREGDPGDQAQSQQTAIALPFTPIPSLQLPQNAPQYRLHAAPLKKKGVRNLFLIRLAIFVVRARLVLMNPADVTLKRFQTPAFYFFAVAALISAS
jgi:hypothetical protein